MRACASERASRVESSRVESRTLTPLDDRPVCISTSIRGIHFVVLRAFGGVFGDLGVVFGRFLFLFRVLFLVGGMKPGDNVVPDKLTLDEMRALRYLLRGILLLTSGMTDHQHST